MQKGPKKMRLALRTFFVVKGEIKRIGLDRFSRIGRNGMPEYAGQKIPYALLAFESEHGKLGELCYRECGYLVFDKHGNIDQQDQWNQVRLSQASEGDPNSFAARRAKQIRQVNTWHPTGEQLGQMISLVKKRR
jgi:hypothetical protein